MACLSSFAAAPSGRAMILLSGSCHGELSSEVAKSVQRFSRPLRDRHTLLVYI